MSAYVCDNDHIKFLITAELFGQYDRVLAYEAPESFGSLDVRAKMLQAENITSVNHRYNESPKYEAVTYTKADYEIHRSWFTNPHVGHAQRIAQVFKSIDCYEYQSCEHEGWEDAPAQKFCNELRSAWGKKMVEYEKGVYGCPDFKGPDLTEARKKREKTYQQLKADRNQQSLIKTKATTVHEAPAALTRRPVQRVLFN